MKKHWTKKLKEENEKLKSDLYKILEGDFETITTYKVIRKASQDLEKQIWK